MLRILYSTLLSCIVLWNLHASNPAKIRASVFQNRYLDPFVLSGRDSIPTESPLPDNVKPEKTKSSDPRIEKIMLRFPGDAKPRPVTLEIRDGVVFWNGDIALYREEDYEQKKLEKGNMLTYTSGRWPSGVIPYTIEPGHSGAGMVNSAISQINEYSNVCMVPRTTELNYVEFIDDQEACWSYVGMIGGKQQINVDFRCGIGATIHEICHAAGMWHEQSRNDRDTYVTVLFENIEAGKEGNFEIGGADILSVGNYDYGSIMHYGAYFFSKNGLPTIQVKSPPAPGGTQIGQRSGLSSGDVASLNTMYPVRNCAGGAFLTVSPTTLDVSNTAQTKTFAITSNVGWTVSESLSWLSVSPASGSSNGTVTVTFTENTSGSTRSGTITISGTNVSNETITVTQSAAPPPCAVPANLTLLDKDYSWFTASWNAVSGATAYSWRYKRAADASWVTNDSWSGLNIASASKVPCTDYVFQVRAVCGSAFSNWSPELQFATEGCGDPYCNSNGIAFGDWIKRVNFSDISGTSESNYGYANFTGTSASVTQGQSYPITLFSGSNANSQGSTYNWQVWIDFNQDNDFSDAGENVFSQSASKATSASSGVTGNITIPSNATIGTTRMRVAMSLSSGDSPCATSSNYREVEDYGVSISVPSVSLSVSPASLSFVAAGETKQTSVSSNVAWTVAESLSWLSVSPASGSNNGSINIQADPNTSTVARTGTVTISGSGVSSQSVSVSQAGVPVQLSATPGSLNFTNSGGDLSFSISSNITWTASESLSWLSLSATSGTGNGSLTATAQANTSTATRTGTITLSGPGAANVTISVSQAGAPPELGATPTTLSFGSAGGGLNLSINSNITWTASESLSWLSLSATSGTGTGSLTATAQANTTINPRSGTITLSGPGVANVTITVSQAAAEPALSATPASLNFTGPGGSLSLSVSSNIAWTLTENLSWLTVSATSGNGSSTLTLTAESNSSVVDRSGTFTLSGPGVTTVTISVTQAGLTPVLGASLETLNFTADGGGISVDISSNIAWTASESLSWITLSTSSGTGNGNIVVTAQANTATSARTGAITLTGTNGVSPVVITINQAAALPFLTATPTAMSFGPEGGMQDLTISANINWFISGSFPWITLENNQGNGIVRVKVQTNTTTTARSGTFTINGANGSKVTFTVSQTGIPVQFSVTPGTLNFTFGGGSLNLNLTANVTWTASESLSWLSLNTTSGSGSTTLTATAQANPTTTTRTGTITLSSPEAASITISVSQAGAPPELGATPGALSFTSAGGGLNLSINSNITWTASESLSWLSLSATSGTGTGSLTATAQANTTINPRSGTITLSGPGVANVTITVSQAAAEPALSATPASLNFTGPGGSLSLSVSSNIAWTLLENISWLTVSATSGNGSSSLTVTAESNSSVVDRSGTFTLSGPGVTTVTISVTQAGLTPVLGASLETLNFTADGGGISVDISSNIAWTASESLSWITLSAGSGNGNGNIVVTAQANTATSARTGTITLMGTNGVSPVVITINQAAALPFLTATPTAMSFGPEGGMQNLAISANINWFISGSFPWITLENNQGSGIVRVKVQTNTTTTTRSGTFTINGANGSKVTFTVSQTGIPVQFSATPGTLNFTSGGGGLNLNLTANVAWTVSESLSWLSLNTTSGSGSNILTATAQANPTTTTRTGTITLSSPEAASITISVSQAGAPPELTATPTTLNFTTVGGSLNLSISSNIAWTASENLSWLTLSTTSGNGNGTLTATAEANAAQNNRSGTITLSGPGVANVVITVFQAGTVPELTATPGTLTFTSAGGNLNLGISSNIVWTASENLSWLTLSATGGTGNGTLTATAQVNTATTSRSGTITLSGSGVPSVVITVNQAAAEPFLLASPGSMSFMPEGGSKDLTVASNIIWSISKNISWITLDTSGGNGVVKVIAAANTATTPRSGIITLSGPGVTNITLSVSQAGVPVQLSVTPGTLIFNSAGGNLNLNITANIAWTASENLSWLTLSAASGTGNGTLTATAQVNTSTAARSGTISLSGAGATPIVITVNQAAADPFLTAVPGSLSFGPDGGKQNLTIASNINWTISKNISWITLDTSGGSGVVKVTAEANLSTVPRSGTISVIGTGIAGVTIAVTQSGAEERLTVVPDSVVLGPLKDSLLLTLQSNTNWSIVDTVDWISLNKTGGQANSQIVLSATENGTLNRRVARIGFRTASLTRTVIIVQNPPEIKTPDSWVFKTGPVQHTLLLPMSLVSEIGNRSLQPGDQIGVFFVAQGKEVCAGSGIWTSVDTDFLIYGDNPLTAIREGMVEGERFRIKIWQARTREEWRADAVFEQPVAGSAVNASDKFRSGGRSRLLRIQAYKTEVQPIPIKKGWNTVSMFVVPEELRMDSLFVPYRSLIESVRDGSGRTFLTNSTLNAIGNWKIEEGYRIRANEDGVLRFEGRPVRPESTPIPVRSGWQIIPFFSRIPQSPGLALASLAGRIDLLKDNDGRIFLPQLSINTIGMLQPGQGYQLRARTTGELRYPESGMALPGTATARDMLVLKAAVPAFFTGQGLHTGVNATLVIPADVAGEVMEPGDEIGVFSDHNILCGAARFNGEHLAIAVWGDEASVPGLEGMRSGERYQLRVWKSRDNQVYPVTSAQFDIGDERYQEDDLEIAGQLLLSAEPLVADSRYPALQVFPNPGYGEFTVLAGKSLQEEVTLRITDISGKRVFEQKYGDWPAGVRRSITLQDIPSGVYILQLTGKEGLWTEKLQVLK